MVVGAVVSRLAKDVTGVISMLDSIVQSALRFNYLAVQYTIDGTTRVVEAGCRIATAIGELLVTCRNDLDIFIADSADGLCEAFEAIAATFYIPIRFFTILLTPFVLLWDLVIATSNFVTYICGLIINTAALVGFTVITAPSQLAKLCFFFTWLFLNCMKSCSSSILTALTAVPKEAYFGFAITTVLFWVTKWVIRRHGVRILVRITKRSVKYIVGRTKNLTSRMAQWFVEKCMLFRRSPFQVLAGDVNADSDTETSDVSTEEVQVPDVPVTPRRVLTRAALRRENEAKAVLDELARERESQLCVVCQDERKSVAIMPCRHMCLCEPCAMTLRNRDPFCPMCRSYMREVIPLYS